MIDWDDIQAQETRRREVEVKAGRSAIETKYEDSVYKELIRETKDELSPSTEEEFKDTVQNDPMPGYNMVSPDPIQHHKDKIEATKKAVKEQEKESQRLAKLQQEAAENELKVTRTATGQPKVDSSGKEVEPIQNSDDNPNPSANPAKGTEAPKTDSKSGSNNPPASK